MERFLDFQFKKEARLLPLFLNQSFRDAAVAFLSLFSSIYVYKTLFSLTSQPNLALSAVFIYFLSLYGCKFISNLLAEELSLKLGLKRQIYFGLFSLSLCLLILFLSLKYPFLLFLASPFWGFSAGFYWFGRHGLIVKTGRMREFGKELGMVEVIRTLLLLGVPFLGGILINWAGYPALFGTSLFFVILAAFSIRPSKEEKTHYDTSLAEVLDLFKTHKKVVLAYIGNSVGTTIYGIAIPLYLFLILKKELSLGEFFSLSMILVALINLIVGRWIDIKGKRGVLTFGSLISSLVWVGRWLTSNIAGLFVIDIADRLTAGMTALPLEVLTFEKALDGRSTGRAILFREIALLIGAIFACVLLMILALLGMELRYSFLLAAIFSLTPILIVTR